MVQMISRRAVWSLNRLYLRHGTLAAVGAMAVAGVLALLLGVILAAYQLAVADSELTGRGQPVTSPAAPVAPRERQQLPVPIAALRFDVTRRILTVLQDTQLAPERIRFKFENAGDAGLTRQIATFTVKAAWSDIADMLAQLQATDRAVYIARLRVFRESADDELLTAEVQLALALREEDGLGGTP